MNRASELAILTFLASLVTLRLAEHTCSDSSTADGACYHDATLSDETTLLQQDFRAAAQALSGGGGGGGAAAAQSGNCDADFPSEKAVVDGYMGVAKTKVLLFGWLGCPCTHIAQSRFGAKALCYEGRQWADFNSKLMQYLQCKVNSQEHHSFIYFRDTSGAWKFHGNGFGFAETAMKDADLNKLISDSGAATTCKHLNIKTNIFGEQLEECRSDAYDSGGSWNYDGTCSEENGGIHQVCIEQLPADFSSQTHQSAWSKQRKDKRHCVCIGAWSLYMTDHANHQDGANAITPHCKAIPETVISGRYLANWKDWNGYPARLVVGLKELVSRCIGQGNAKEKCELKKRFDKVVAEVKELQGAKELAGLNTTLHGLSCS